MTTPTFYLLSNKQKLKKKQKVIKKHLLFCIFILTFSRSFAVSFPLLIVFSVRAVVVLLRSQTITALSFRNGRTHTKYVSSVNKKFDA